MFLKIKYWIIRVKYAIAYKSNNFTLNFKLYILFIGFFNVININLLISINIY
jgi:hypothetical protein